MRKPFITKFIKFVLLSGLAGVLFNIILWLLALGKFGLSRDIKPLHFSVVYGIDFVGKGREILELPGFGLLVLAVNLWTAKRITKEYRLLSYFLIVGAELVQLILILALIALAGVQ